MKVLKITKEQKDLLVGKQFQTDCYFNPILDKNDNWIISLEEREYNTNEEINWLSDLEEIDYEPIIIETNDMIGKIQEGYIIHGY